MQPDGLNIRKVNKMFGGQQPKMRQSELTSKSCFGPYHTSDHALQLGDKQTMTFSSTDIGPFYFTPVEREKRKFDKDTGKTTTKVHTRSTLIKMLKDAKILNPTGSLKHLQAQCMSLDLPTTYTQEKIQEGWVGKPKGALQILYEQGWVDPERWRKYTDKGRINEMGILQENTSLHLLMQKQTDFTTEMTLLQFYGSKMGVVIDRTPKCHPEIAGEGIEYLWATTKLYYRNQPLSRKKSKEKFEGLVNECLSRNNLTLSHVRKCSRRVREYMRAYKMFEKAGYTGNQSAQQVGQDNHESNKSNKTRDMSVQLNYELIEKTIKTYKSHRNARDFDVTFIRSLKLDKTKEEFIKEVVTKMKSSF
jgi:hypothetical protein